MKIFIFALFLSVFSSPLWAGDQPLTAEQHARAVHLDEQLRCVVCQSESIGDSEADMARDMRLLVQEKIEQGWSDAKILNFMKVRYGDFILLNPPVQSNTYLLWALPILFFIGALGLVRTLFRRRKERS